MFQGQPVYRVGGGVLPPRALDTPDPKYPEKLRKKRIEGHVVLKLIVGTDGAAHEITVDRSGGTDFDREALKAVQRWKFQPATKDGEAVNAMINVEVNFRLY
jgi:protein TonB